MSFLRPNLQIMSHVVWGTSDEEIAEKIGAAEKLGWAWDGQVHWHKTASSRICVAVLTSLTSVRAVTDLSSPRLLLTRA